VTGLTTATEQQPGPLAPLREQDYRRFFIGSLASNLGTFCQSIAQSLYIYQETRSTFLVGVVNFAQFAAVPVLAPIAGTIADRYDRRRVLILAQSGALATSGLLAVIALAGALSPMIVIVAATLIGVTSAFAFPIGRAFAPALVTSVNLGRAVNLDSVSVNIARALGPVIGALIVDRFGVRWAFTVNALSFTVLIGALASISPRFQATPPNRSRFRDGLGILRDRPLVGALLFVIAACAIGADPPVTLGPELAHRFGGGDTLAGLILGAFGAGGVTGAFVAGAESARHHRKVARLLGLLVAGLLLFAFATRLPFVLLGSFVAGFGYLTAQTRTSTLLVRSIADHERGRIMALWSIAFIGTRPVASLLDGLIGDLIDLRVAALVMALPAAAAIAVSVRLDRQRLDTSAPTTDRGGTP
jgi:MFS family permease